VDDILVGQAGLPWQPGSHFSLLFILLGGERARRALTCLHL